MQTIFKLFFTSLAVASIGIILVYFFYEPVYEEIKQPPLEIPEDLYIQKKSVIQIPITIQTKEIRQAILDEIKNPIASGVTKEITTDIFNIKPPQPLESWPMLRGMTNFTDKTFQAGIWVNHKVYLIDVQIHFEGKNVKIFTSYAVAISIDYKQSPLPFVNALKSTGVLTGYLEANVALHGEIFIDDNAKLHIKASQDTTKVQFTKINFPYKLNVLELLNITQTENFIKKNILEESVNKSIFAQIEKQIAKKQVDLQLAQKIQKIVYDNSNPLALSENLWLVPGAEKISISQINGEDKNCNNILSINVGILAKPELFNSDEKPFVLSKKSIPLSCEEFSPKIYLYPNINLQYSYMATLIEKGLQSFITKEYPQEDYTINNVKIYPSNKKLVLSIDLIQINNSNKILTFYMWGTPSLDQENMHIKLKNLDYTLESNAILIKAAHWILDDKIKNFIEQNLHFNYKEKFKELSEKLAKIEHESNKKILSGAMHSLEIEEIFTAKDAIVLHAEAIGSLSYKVNLYNEKLEK